MQFSKLVASIGLIVLGSFSINASAQTSLCTWSSVYGSTSNGYTSVTFLCRSSNNAVLASRQDNNPSAGPFWCGSITIASGYKSAGSQGTGYPATCNVAIVAANTPVSSTPTTSASTSSSSAAPVSCKTGTVTYSTPEAFFPSVSCGPQPACGFSVTSISYTTTKKYTCL